MGSSDLSDISIEPTLMQSLTEDQKNRLTDILDHYLSALETGVPADTARYCDENPDLAEVLRTYFESIDELHGISAGFSGPSEEPETESQNSDDEHERRLGDFILKEEIGRGGMGVVYAAEQISLQRSVAVKVLPFAAVLDSKQIARFKNEAQAAAQLHHPNIVPVYAVGSERGVHFYAMQLIDGAPLDGAIEELRGDSPGPAQDGAAQDKKQGDISTHVSFLTSRSRDDSRYIRAAVGLGIQAADALQTAHEYGVVHRDIKPSNLLLDSEGKIWITDFGLARCQNDASLTKTGDVFGTMRYMSPEQALGQTALVDQRADIYSLAVTLYELIALQAAFPDAEGAALLKMIEQHEPAPLRTFRSDVPADLETVLRKAMAKSRDERYETAQAFADDLRRVLDGRPTLARPPSLIDRAAKWSHRHRRIVSVVAVFLTIMLGATATGFVLVNQQKEKAEANALTASKRLAIAKEAIWDVYEYSDELVGIPAAEPIRRKMLQRALVKYRELAREAQNNESLRDDLANLYVKIGRLAQDIGDLDEALKAHHQARELFAELAADAPRNTDLCKRRALALGNLADCLAATGKNEEATGTYQSGIELLKSHKAKSSEQDVLTQAKANLLNNLGQLQAKLGQPQAAEVALTRAIDLQKQLTENDRNAVNLRSLATMIGNRASSIKRDAKTDLSLQREALKYQLAAVELAPENVLYRSEVAIKYSNLGVSLAAQGQTKEAIEAYERAIAIQEQLPANHKFLRDLAYTYNNLGSIQRRQGDLTAARNSIQHAVQRQELVVQQNPLDLTMQSSLGGMHNNLAAVHEALSEWDSAAESYEFAIMHQMAAAEGAPDVPRFRDYLNTHYYGYGRVLRKMGKMQDSVRVALQRKKLRRDGRHLFLVAEEIALSCQNENNWRNDEVHRQQAIAAAVVALRESVAAGYVMPPKWFAQPEFECLKNHPEFEKLVRG